MSMTNDLRTRPATRISLARMRDEHQRLLEMASDESRSLGPLTREHLMQFVHEVASTGTLLRHSDERRVAQGVLDYWVATLNANSSGLETPITAPEPVSIRLARFEAAAVDELTANAGALASELGGKSKSVMLALIMALLEPDDSRRRLVLVVQTREQWIKTCTAALSLDAEKVATVADRLIAAGLVLETTLPTPPSPVVELAAHGLTEGWQTLAEAVAERLRFREHALLWNDEVATAGALVAGVPPGASAAPSTAWTRALASAGLAPYSAGAGRPLALDPLEQEYAKHQRAQATRRLRWTFGVLCVLLVGAGVAISLLIDLWSEAHRQRLKAEEQARIANEQTEHARNESARANAAAAREREARRLADDTAGAARRRADEASSYAQRVTDEIRTLVREGRVDRALLTGILREDPSFEVGLQRPGAPLPVAPLSVAPLSVAPLPVAPLSVAPLPDSPIATPPSAPVADVQELNAPQGSVRTGATQRFLTIVRDGGIPPTEQDSVIGALSNALRDGPIRTWSATGRYNLIFVLSEIPTAVWRRPSLRETVAQLSQSIGALKGRMERGETQAGPDTRRFLTILERRLAEADASPVTAIVPLSVYAHVASAGDREIAAAIVRSLGAEFPLEGVEYIATWGVQSRATGQVRFYRSDQGSAAQGLAQRLRSATIDQTGRNVVFETHDISRTFPNLPDGRIEVWFPQLEPR